MYIMLFVFTLSMLPFAMHACVCWIGGTLPQVRKFTEDASSGCDEEIHPGPSNFGNQASARCIFRRNGMPRARLGFGA